MINNLENKVKHSKTSFYLFFIVYVIFIFGIQISYKNYLFNLSMDLIEHLQKSGPALSNVCYYFSYLSDVSFLFTFITILYTFVNIYKTFIFFCALYLTNFITGFLSLLYKGSRPFWNIPSPTNLHNFHCEIKWGNPSLTSVNTLFLYLTLWRIIFENDRKKIYRKTKIVILILVLILVIFLDLCGIFTGEESFDQILFGFTLGFGMYFLFFYVICLDLNNAHELYNVLQISYFKVVSFVTILIALSFIIFLWDPNYTLLTEEQRNNIISNPNCQDVGPDKQLNRNSLLLTCSIIGIISVFVGMKSELFFRFGNDFNLWRDFNFVKEAPDNESLLSTTSFTKDAQWNHTNGFISFLRLIITLMILIVFFLPYILLNDSNFPVSVIIKVMLPSALFPFFIMYPFRYFLMKMKIINRTRNMIPSRQTSSFD